MISPRELSEYFTLKDKRGGVKPRVIVPFCHSVGHSLLEGDNLVR
jgi:hypothetical protein